MTGCRVGHGLFRGTGADRPDVIYVAGLGEPVLVQLQSPDSPHKIAAGNDVTLRCSVDGSGEVHIEWYR